MMRLIQKLSTAMRGGAREVLEDAVDANAITILSQEIYDCESAMRDSKKHLANVVVEKRSLKRQLDAHKATVSNKERAIKDKLAQDDNAGALKLAEALAAQETLLDKQQTHYNQLETYEADLLQTLKTTTYTLSEYRTELGMAKATQEAQKSMSKLSVHKKIQKDNFGLMQDSVERIRQKQMAFDDQLQAMQDIDSHIKGEPTQKEVRSQHAQSILDRFK